MSLRSNNPMEDGWSFGNALVGDIMVAFVLVITVLGSTVFVGVLGVTGSRSENVLRPCVSVVFHQFYQHCQLALWEICFLDVRIFPLVFSRLVPCDPDVSSRRIDLQHQEGHEGCRYEVHYNYAMQLWWLRSWLFSCLLSPCCEQQADSMDFFLACLHRIAKGSELCFRLFLEGNSGCCVHACFLACCYRVENSCEHRFRLFFEYPGPEVDIKQDMNSLVMGQPLWVMLCPEITIRFSSRENSVSLCRVCSFMNQMLLQLDLLRY